MSKDSEPNRYFIIAGRFSKMLWSWKKGDSEVLTAEMSELKHENKVLQLEEFQVTSESGIGDGITIGSATAETGEQLDNNNANPIDQTGTR